MSIGSFLLTPENLADIAKKSWKFGRAALIEQGLRYYDRHPQDVAQIVANLDYMGLASTGAALDAVLHGIVAHYYEKLFIFVKTFEAVWIAKNRIDMGRSLEPFQEAVDTGKSVFLAQSHFGATYFMGITLMARSLDIHVVGNFPEPAGSLMQKQNQLYVERYQTGSATLINLAQPNVDVPMEMIRCLLTKKIITNVFDENNQFSRIHTLLGKNVSGGSGMDLILRNFSDEKVLILTPFLVRTSDETFEYQVDRHYLSSGNIIASFYKSLEQRVAAHPEQWYFIHELHHSIPEDSVP